MNGALRYALLEEVRNATGFSANRACDALAFSFWPSDGLTLIGYEIKVSRADWLRELKDPEKAFAFARYCDEWWIVAGHVGLVQEEELPPNWGLLVPNAKGKLHPVRAAHRLTPEPMSRAMLMAIVRTACNSTWEPQIAAMRQSMRKEAEARAATSKRDLQREFDDLKARVQEFEEASGVKIPQRYSGESPERIGEIVRAVRGVLTNGYDGALQTISGHARTLKRLVAECEAAAREIEQLQQQDRARPVGGAA